MLPTVTLSWHPGHGRQARLGLAPGAFAALAGALAASPLLAEIGAVLTGYLGEAGDAAALAGLVDAVKARNPGALYLCDPVIGDDERLYVPEATAAAIRDLLLPRADIATPNRFELGWLTGTAGADNEALLAAARRLGPPTVLVTSAFAPEGRAAAMLATAEAGLLASHRGFAAVPHGSGDLMAALFLARRLAGASGRDALAAAVGGTAAMLREAVRADADELPLAAAQALLEVPDEPVAVTRLDGCGAGPRWVAGVDGCPAGWVVVYRDLAGREAPQMRVEARFADILGGPFAPEIVAVDMPVGLPERAGRGGRGPESVVRPLLGPRQSSVFSVPSRAAVMAEPDGYRAASAIALATSEPPRRISKQAFMLFRKIREIDALMTPALEARVHEVHPELAFWRLNGGRPMALPKKVKGAVHEPGLAERRALLAAEGYAPAFLAARLRGAGPDDVLDAAVAALIAERIAEGAAESFPAVPERDARGLRMAIWA
jgi:pyridoxal kinase